MKRVVVRLAVEDDTNVAAMLASVLDHVPKLRGAMVVGGDASTVLVSASRHDPAHGREVAEFLAAGDDGELDEIGVVE